MHITDGLRCLAIYGVVGFHLDNAWLILSKNRFIDLNGATIYAAFILTPLRAYQFLIGALACLTTNEYKLSDQLRSLFCYANGNGPTDRNIWYKTTTKIRI